MKFTLYLMREHSRTALERATQWINDYCESTFVTSNNIELIETEQPTFTILVDLRGWWVWAVNPGFGEEGWYEQDGFAHLGSQAINRGEWDHALGRYQKEND